MKVLHVMPAVGQAYGGPSRAAWLMTEELARLGVEVDLAATTADGEGDLDVPLGVPLEHNGVRVWYFARQWPRGWQFSWPLRRWLHARAGDYDLLHVHAVFSYSVLPACASAWRHGRPYVVRPTGALNDWALGYRSWKKRPYWAALLRRHFRRAAAFHATSTAEAESLTRLGFGDRTRVIPIGIELGQAVARASTAGEPLRLLSLSRLHPVKALPVLLDAARLLQDGGLDYRLTVAGEGPPSYRRVLEDRSRDLGISDRVSFVGYVEGAEKARLLRENDLFVLASYQENFGVSLVEAMAAGLPVVTSDQVGIAPDVAEHDAGIVVPVDSPERIASAIRELAPPEPRLAAGHAARRLVETRFSREAQGKGLVELYRELLGDSS